MSKRRMKHVPISTLHCTECGTAQPIPRVKRQREKNHIKDLYCYKCMTVTKHEEQRECDHIFTMGGVIL